MTSKERLENLAAHALKEAKGDCDAAAKILLPSIIKLGLTETLLSAYLETRNGASHRGPESHREHDRPDSDPSSSRPSQLSPESQYMSDRPAAPLTRDDGASLTLHESQADIDRSVAPAPKKIATVSADMKRAARRSIFDMPIIKTTSFLWGDITPSGFHNLHIRNAFTTELEALLERIIRRASHDEQPLREYATEAEIEAIALGCKAKEKAARHVVKEMIDHAMC